MHTEQRDVLASVLGQNDGPVAPPATPVGGNGLGACSLCQFHVPEPWLLRRILTAGQLIWESPGVGPGVLGIGCLDPMALEADFQEAVEAVHAEGDYLWVHPRGHCAGEGPHVAGQDGVRSATVDRFTLPDQLRHSLVCRPGVPSYGGRHHQGWSCIYVVRIPRSLAPRPCRPLPGPENMSPILICSCSESDSDRPAKKQIKQAASCYLPRP